MPPHPDEMRRGGLKEQTPRTARTVLTTPSDVDARQMIPAYTANFSPSQSRWISREPPSSSHNVSGTADAIAPGECASHNGPYHEAAVRQEPGCDQSPTETPSCLFGEVSDTSPAFAHAMIILAQLPISRVDEALDKLGTGRILSIATLRPCLFAR